MTLALASLTAFGAAAITVLVGVTIFHVSLRFLLGCRPSDEPALSDNAWLSARVVRRLEEHQAGALAELRRQRALIRSFAAARQGQQGTATRDGQAKIQHPIAG